MAHHFDVFTTNAVDLQNLLQANKITSVQIVDVYLAQISRHEPRLDAFICLAPIDVLNATATLLDQERLQGRSRGPLHGIPIVLKDCFITASTLGMGTTAGAAALVNAKASVNGAVVQRLLDAGLIIVGKTNMTEFAGMKTDMVMPGWSAVGGQTLSPYVARLEPNETMLGHSAPGGSSTGSAVAVAAGFSPLAMGTETIGSIVTPATRAALYALKPTVGVQDTAGMYTMTDFFDSPGPMAKCAADVLLLAETLLGRSLRSPDLQTWEGLSAAFLDPRVWKMAEPMCRQFEGTAEQMEQDYETVVHKLKAQGCSVKYPVNLEDTGALTVDGGQAIMPIAFWEFKNVCLPRFLGAFDESPIRSLADLVGYNEQHRDRCLPPPFTEQTDLIEALNNDNTAEHIAKLKGELRAVGKRILDHVFDGEGVNLIIAPGDAPLCVHAAAAGYPVATVPVGQLKYNGRPFGLCLVARENDEERLLRFMTAYETFVAEPRAVPTGCS
ncbi:amidase signature domain-containing protein [Lasiosphaeria ovina]|uniref:Amidase signature domain-containing protein n=1 Tax=Lasiosphaeria ovina TaxID=92902 RepID=A0AAE0KEZ6_9PEZI|nr:amidase signature domain-containing protein [Lasiosphaeria ovina]